MYHFLNKYKADLYTNSRLKIHFWYMIARTTNRSLLIHRHRIIISYTKRNTET